MILKTAAIAFLVASTTVAQADTDKELGGNELLAQCQRTDFNGRSWCFGYVMGVSEMFVETGMYGLNACPSATIPQTQLVDIVVKHLKDNPADRHIGARYLIGAALYRAFPCRPKS